MDMKRLVFTLALATTTTFVAAQMRPGMQRPGMGQPGTSQPEMGQPSIPMPDNQQDATAKPSQQPKVDDETLRSQVAQQLASRPSLANVQVTVDNGVARLEGSVPQKEDRKEAKNLAKSVPGVRGVKEKLTVSSIPAVTTAGSVAGATSVPQSSTSSENTAGSISGNTQAESGTAAGNSSMAQTSSTSSAPSTNPGTNPGSSTAGAIGSSTQSPAGSQSSSTTTETVPQSAGSQSGATSTTSPAGSQSGSNTTLPQSSTSGSQGSSTTGTPSSSSSGVGTSGTFSTSGSIVEISTKLQNALNSEPTLANDSVVANVTEDTIELSGNVATAQARQTANRIAQSFAANRRVIDRITLKGTSAPPVAPNQSVNPR